MTIPVLKHLGAARGEHEEIFEKGKNAERPFKLFGIPIAEPWKGKTQGVEFMVDSRFQSIRAFLKPHSKLYVGAEEVLGTVEISWLSCISE